MKRRVGSAQRTSPDSPVRNPVCHCQVRVHAALPRRAFVPGDRHTSTVLGTTAKPGGRSRTIRKILSAARGRRTQRVRSLFLHFYQRESTRATERNRPAPSRTNGLCGRLAIKVHRTTPPNRFETIGPAGSRPRRIRLTGGELTFRSGYLMLNFGYSYQTQVAGNLASMRWRGSGCDYVHGQGLSDVVSRQINLECRL